LHLASAADSIRAQWAALQSPDPPEEGAHIAITVPYRNLFDRVAAALQRDPEGHVARVARQYDPALTPAQNLPGGKMTAVQKRFVEKVWRPVARPRLIAAGFWQIANIE
jgi:hypothetical protein